VLKAATDVAGEPAVATRLVAEEGAERGQVGVEADDALGPPGLLAEQHEREEHAVAGGTNDRRQEPHHVGRVVGLDHAGHGVHQARLEPLCRGRCVFRMTEQQGPDVQQGDPGRARQPGARAGAAMARHVAGGVPGSDLGPRCPDARLLADAAARAVQPALREDDGRGVVVVVERAAERHLSARALARTVAMLEHAGDELGHGSPRGIIGTRPVHRRQPGDVVAPRCRQVAVQQRGVHRRVGLQVRGAERPEAARGVAGVRVAAQVLGQREIDAADEFGVGGCAQEPVGVQTAPRGDHARGRRRVAQ